MSSVPYVPPDTMKNVAATRGQTVNFATFFFVEEIARERNWAGRVMVLNFLSRPPSAILALSLPRKVERVRLTAIEEYGNSRAMQEKTWARLKNFETSAARSSLRKFLENSLRVSWSCSSLASFPFAARAALRSRLFVARA